MNAMTVVFIAIAIALLVTVVPRIGRRTPLSDLDEALRTQNEEHASIGQRFVGNLLTILIGMPGLFFFVAGALKTIFATEHAIRSEGPWWILVGVVLIAVSVYLRQRILRR